MIAIIILSIVVLGLGFLSGIIFSDKEVRPASAFCLVTAISIFVIAAIEISEDLYKQGQIDAAQGIQKYHLTTQPGKWELKEK